MKKNFIIYKVTNKINGKIYIGKTYNLEKRKNQHVKDKNHNIPFHRALKKYGLDNFEWEIIDHADSDKEIREKEIYWIKKLNTCIHFENSNGYNVTLGGEGGTSWNTRPVLQFDLNGNYIDSYVSCSHASVETGVQRHDIGDCANRKQERAGDYIWRFQDECEELKVNPYKKPESKRKKRIIQLNLDGSFLNSYESVDLASKLTGIRRSNISACLINQVRRAGGFQWIYESDYDDSKDYRFKGIKEGNGIYQLDEDMNIVNHFNNCTEAARALNEPDKVHKQIHKALSCTKKCRGFRWMKVDDYNNNYANTELTY